MVVGFSFHFFSVSVCLDGTECWTPSFERPRLLNSVHIRECFVHTLWTVKKPLRTRFDVQWSLCVGCWRLAHYFFIIVWTSRRFDAFFPQLPIKSFFILFCYPYLRRSVLFPIVFLSLMRVQSRTKRKKIETKRNQMTTRVWRTSFHEL